eukprot:SM000081S22654  [mRNA]  locus=s81:375761:378255:- [translate_table: standard]
MAALRRRRRPRAPPWTPRRTSSGSAPRSSGRWSACFRSATALLPRRLPSTSFAAHEENARLRRLETAGSCLRSEALAMRERVNVIERDVPQLAVGLAELRAQLGNCTAAAARSDDLRSRVAALEACHSQQLGMALLLEQHSTSLQQHSSAQGFLAGLARGLGERLWACASQADRLAVYFARKVLLDSIDGCNEGIRLQTLGSTLSKGAIVALPRLEAVRKRRRALVGAAILVASVECSFRLQRALRRPLPSLLKSMTSPMEYGLRGARLAVWASAFVVATQELKRGCFRLADALEDGSVFLSSQQDQPMPQGAGEKGAVADGLVPAGAR